MDIYADACMKPTKLLCLYRDPVGAKVFVHTAETHNQAEYEAIRLALYAPVDFGNIVVYSDSELAVSQINSALGRRLKEYKCEDPQLRKLLDRVVELVNVRQFHSLTTEFKWVPREENWAGIALEEKCAAIKRGSPL